MKICFFLVSLENGGTEMYLLRFLRYLLEKENVDVTVFCKGKKSGVLKPEYESLSVKIVYHKVGYISISGIRAIYNVVRHQHVVCDLTGNFAGIPMLLSRIAKVKKRVAFYRASTDHYKPSHIRNFYNFCLNRLIRYCSTDILSNSKAAFVYYFRGFFESDNRFGIIPNGVRFTDNDLDIADSFDIDNLKIQYKIPINKTIIGHVGRFNNAKNFPFIFDVIKRLKEREKVDFHFVFCGRGTDSKEFKKLLKIKNIDSYCTTLGSQQHMLKVYSLYDCFFFPSKTEGQPNALIEAMILGIPFVTSNIAPIKEAIPKEAVKCLVDLKSIDYACNLLEKICFSPNKDEYKFKSWALAHFDPEIRFMQFSKILLGN